MKQWFYAKNGQRIGPVNKTVIQELYDKGELAPNNLVWEEGTTDWAAVSTLFQKGSSPISSQNAITPTEPAIASTEKNDEIPDYGKFLCWGIALVLVPYLGTAVLIICAILICLEIVAVRKAIRAGKLSPSSYGNLHPVVGVLIVAICGIFLYPLVMYWRNKSGYFKPQPHAVWFSIVISILVIIVACCLLFLYYLALGLGGGFHHLYI